jgi:hypothetical protein
VVVYGLHPGEPLKERNDFIQQTGVTFPIVNSNNTLYHFDFAPGVGFPYPRDVIVGKDLTVRSIKNSFDIEETKQLIDQLLAE